jgi:hypothetical protein
MDTRVIQNSSGKRIHRQDGNDILVGDMHAHEGNKTYHGRSEHMVQNGFSIQ